MKTLYVLFTIIIIAAIGFTVYTLYDTKKFIEKNQIVPEVLSEENSSSLSRQNVQTQIAPERNQIKSGSHDHSSEHSSEGEKSKTADVTNHEHDTSHSHTHLEEGISPPIATNPKRADSNLDPLTDPKLKQMGKWLVKNYPDSIDEINEFLNLKQKSMRNRIYIPSQDIWIESEISIDDEIREAELAAKFYPLSENMEYLERLQERKARIDSGDLQLVDPSTIDWDNIVIVTDPEGTQ